MSLNTLWFWLIAVLFLGYFFLEGFDYGVGILMPWVGRTDTERRAVLASIGPVWDANEVWLITAGGALFAAFPLWYASLFSGFYLVMALLLVALIVRGVGLEFRSKDQYPAWRRVWDGLIVFGSVVPPLLWGVAMANMLAGLPLDRSGNLVGGLLALISPYTVVGGLAAALLLTLHGALYLALKVEGELGERARIAALRVGALATAFYFGFVAMSYFYTNFAQRLGIDPGVVPILAGLAMISVRFFLDRRQYGWGFAMTGATIVLSVLTVFVDLYPDVLVSRLNPRWSLTIYNAASNAYSLHVMTIVALSALPLVLAYQAWTYWVFRRRISLKDSFHY
jgi:cytochrome d ubiquinol oxidase subunit II